MPVHTAIFYEIGSGKILATRLNYLVKAIRQKTEITGVSDPRQVGVIYIPSEVEVKPEEYFIETEPRNQPPRLCSKNGTDITFQMHRAQARSKVASAKNIRIDYEGGMGDQILETEAVLEAMKIYPEKTFLISARPEYRKIISRIKGVPTIDPGPTPGHDFFSDLTISMHSQYLSDPRRGYYGKGSLYGSHLGIDQVKQKAKIQLNEEDIKERQILLHQYINSDNPPLYAIQIRSGSGHGKSWNTEPGMKLARMLRDGLGGRVFLMGAPTEWNQQEEGIFNLGGKTTWWQSCLILSAMSTVIAIDSGVMHLTRALGIPRITLWGGTNAQTILGEDETKHDIRLKLDCYDMICCDCPRKTCACMTGITPAMAYNKILEIYEKT